jgi:hypothetical protein
MLQYFEAVSYRRCIAEDESGKPRLTLTLPDRGALENVAQILARLVAAGSAMQTENG